MKKILFLFCMAAFAFACSSNDDDPVLTVNPVENITLDPAGQEATRISVNTNQSVWEASCSADWLTCTRSDTVLSVIAAKNKDGEARQAEITISAGDAIPVTITVSQQAKLEIGDFYQGGVIFWLNPDENATPRGKVVTLKEMTPAEMTEIEEETGRSLWVDSRKFINFMKSQDINYGELADLTDCVLNEAWDGSTLDDGRKNTELLLKLIDGIDQSKVFMYEFKDAPYMPTNGCELAWFRKNIVEAKEGGFSDWYIPSIKEMEVFTQKIGDKYVYEICNETIKAQKGQLINGMWSEEDLRRDPEKTFYDIWYATSSQYDKDTQNKGYDKEQCIYALRFKGRTEDAQQNLIDWRTKQNSASIIRAIRQF